MRILFFYPFMGKKTSKPVKESNEAPQTENAAVNYIKMYIIAANSVQPNINKTPIRLSSSNPQIDTTSRNCDSIYSEDSFDSHTSNTTINTQPGNLDEIETTISFGDVSKNIESRSLYVSNNTQSDNRISFSAVIDVLEASTRTGVLLFIGFEIVNTNLICISLLLAGNMIINLISYAQKYHLPLYDTYITTVIESARAAIAMCALIILYVEKKIKLTDFPDYEMAGVSGSAVLLVVVAVILSKNLRSQVFWNYVVLILILLIPNYLIFLMRGDIFVKIFVHFFFSIGFCDFAIRVYNCTPYYTIYTILSISFLVFYSGIAIFLVPAFISKNMSDIRP